MKKLRNPMQSAHDAPRCGAHARTTNCPCQAPAMPNGKCRLHGGQSTGRPRIHGRNTNQNRRDKAELRAMLETLRDLIASR